MKVEYVSQRGSSRKVLIGFEVDCVPGVKGREDSLLTMMYVVG
jgi:hypothetical protein